MLINFSIEMTVKLDGDGSQLISCLTFVFRLLAATWRLR